MKNGTKSYEEIFISGRLKLPSALSVAFLLLNYNDAIRM